MVGMAWLLKDWFHLQIFQTLFAALLLLSNWYLLESPTWLAVRRRYKECRDTLITIVRRNGLHSCATESRIEAWLQHMKTRYEEQSKVEKGKFSDLFKNRIIAMYTCAATFLLVAVINIYYGLVMNTESFGSEMYEDLGISIVLSAVSLAVSICFLSKTSVRIVLTTFFLCEGVVCIIYPLAHGFTVARSVLSVLARSLISPCLIHVYTYNMALYPTSVRAVGLGFTAMASRLFSIAVPFTKELGEWTVPFLPFILFAVLSLTCALLMKLLPENKGKALPNTIEELLKRQKRRQDVAVPVHTKI